MSAKEVLRGHLLVVDDEDPQRVMLANILRRSGFEVDVAANGKEAVERLASAPVDLVLTDQRMPEMNGLELLEYIQRELPQLPVVLMTAFGNVSTAVDAMKRGAADYLTKPFERDELLLVIEKALRHRRLEDEVVSLRDQLQSRYRLDNIIGASPPMQEMFGIVERVSDADVPVLITGESGTGKELVARAIHQRSRRCEGPFVALNCSAVPESLLESEFFGHERGAFTGAVKAHQGRFEQAIGGTLFLDEIGAMRVDLQAKLLRAIQEREVQRLGGTAPIKVDVRILAATCDDLEQSIKDRTFREDLYYRLSVIPVHLPPLRDRVDDLPLLIDHFLERSVAQFQRGNLRLEADALERMRRYGWPGNVRELENCIERMVVLTRGEKIGLDDLPPAIRGTADGSVELNEFSLPADGLRLPDLECHLIRQALERTRGGLRPRSEAVRHLLQDAAVPYR